MARVLPAVTAVLGAVALWAWVSAGPVRQVSLRLPGADGAGQAKGETGDVDPASDVRLEQLDGVAAEIAGSWPRFRGGQSDNINRESIRLLREWPGPGPTMLWSVELGEGYAGPAVHNGRAYVLDYDRAEERDVLRCLSLADGRDIWRLSYPVRIKRNHGMSRTVPAVTDKYVVTLGPKCQVMCAEAETGRLLWFLDLVREYETEVPLWYAGQCPLIDNDRAILAPGGQALMIAVDGATGQVAWEAPNPDGWQMTHSSIMPMELGGRRTYVYCGSGGVAGVSAEDGQVLWKTTEWKMRTNVPSPVILDEGRVFLSAGYDMGSMMIQVEEQDGRCSVRTLYRLKAGTFGADQQTPIWYEGYIYGVRPGEGGQLACLDPAEGRVVWSSGEEHKVGLGPLVIGDGLIFVMNDTGLLSLAEAKPEGFSLLAEAQVLAGRDGQEPHDAWGPMALVAGRLLLRDLTRMVCLDVAAR